MSRAEEWNFWHDAGHEKCKAEVARLEGIIHRHSCDSEYEMMRLESEVTRLKSAWSDEAHAASDDMAEYRSAVEYRDAEVTRLEMVIRDIGDTLYGQNLEVMGYHLNGNPKPMDEFFHESNWLEDE